MDAPDPAEAPAAAADHSSSTRSHPDLGAYFEPGSPWRRLLSQYDADADDGGDGGPAQ